MKKYVILRIFILGTIISVSILILIFQPTARAEQFSWLGDPQPTVESRANTPILSTACNTTEKKIIGLNETRSVCIQSNGNFNFATFNHTGPIFKGAVSFGYEKDMYLISDGMCGGYYNDCQYIPDKDMMVSRYYFDGPNFKKGFAIFKNFSKKLTQTKNIFGQVAGYTFPLSTISPDFAIKDVNFRDYQVSKNGNWIVAELKNQGVLRISTSDFNIKKFTNQHNNYNVGVESYMEFSISDDGVWIAVVGWNTEERIYKVDDLCGLVVNSNNLMEDNSYEQCPSRDIRGMLGDKINGLSSMSLPNFSDDGGELQLYIGYYDRTKNETINLQAPGYIAPRLDYLALGDSYSSGEGDTEKDTTTNQKYYRGWTDNEENILQNQPREKCHVSTRSYPYILANGMQLRGTNKWNTVACSGAEVWDVKGGGSSTYKGQGKGGDDWNKPRLEGFNSWGNLKTTALNEYIPGRQKQIEFVKKYKPKAITLTMGGNDIDFGGKLTSCAGVTSPGTCKWGAIEDGSRADLANEIYSQYKKLQTLYTDLYEASNKQTKIYVLGYPQFINGSKNASCSGSNIFQLNSDEREMIHQSVAYFNNVIEQASLSAGVKYIDVERSLDGHRLCDSGERYVTGITGFAGWNGNEQQESFHPNAKGNFAIAMTVWDQVENKSLVEYDICPNSDENACPNSAATKETIDTPEYFQSTTTKNTQNHKLTNSYAVKGQATKLTDEKHLFEPGSSTSKALYSDPVDLGTNIVSAEGSLDASITIPNIVPAGFHTLVISGKSYSGEAIELEQTILIHGPDPSDIDENNIPDVQQSCGPFLIDSGIDTDKDSIDDACDPEIVKTSSQDRTSAQNSDESDSNSTEASNNSPQNISVSSTSSQDKVQSQSSNEDVRQSNNKDSAVNAKKSSLLLVAVLSVIGVMVIIGSVVIWLV